MNRCCKCDAGARFDGGIDDKNQRGRGGCKLGVGGGRGGEGCTDTHANGVRLPINFNRGRGGEGGDVATYS